MSLKFILIKVLKRTLKVTSILLVICLVFFFGYCNNTNGVTKTTKNYYTQLKRQLKAKGYSPNLLVISGKRAEWHNALLTNFGAAKKSRHLKGQAIDIMVLDVNGDYKINTEDVDIVQRQLESIIGNRGGIGTYKSESIIWNKQMIHFDSRGYRARWYR